MAGNLGKRERIELDILKMGLQGKGNDEIREKLSKRAYA